MLKKILNAKEINIQNYKTYMRNRDKGVLVMCRKCYSFNYEGRWHFERPDYLSEKDVDEEISIRLSQCPACVEEALAVYDMEYA